MASEFVELDAVTEAVTVAQATKARGIGNGYELWFAAGPKDVIDTKRSGVGVVRSGEASLLRSADAVAHAIGALCLPDELSMSRARVVPGATIFVGGGSLGRRKLGPGTRLLKVRCPQNTAPNSVRTTGRKAARSNTGDADLDAFLDEPTGTPPAPAAAPGPADPLANTAVSDTLPADDDTPPTAVSLTTGVSFLPPESAAFKKCRHEAPLSTVSFEQALSTSSASTDLGLTEHLAGGAPGTKDTVAVGGHVWRRPHPHVLATVFPDSEGRGSAPRPAARVAAFALDGTLFKATLFDSSPDAFELAHPDVPALLQQLGRDGYLLLFLASYPSLHRANAAQLQDKLDRIRHVVDVAVQGVAPVTVILSVVSRLQKSSHTMPGPGLWQLFCRRMGEPLLAFSFYVGNCGDDDAGDEVCTESGSEDAAFAAACRLSFFDAAQFYARQLPAFC